MKSPVLSICIATYNRADVIGQTLDSIVSQIRDGVEIVIVDGASTDNTADVMRRYQANCPSLRYYRMPVKGGVDLDYCHAVSYATGDYCWLLTDDDIVKPGAIDAILGYIAKKYSLIIINAEVWDRTFAKQLEHKHLHVDENAFYGPEAMEDLFVDTVIYLSFIGAVVIDRALWNTRQKKPYIGTEFVHVGVIFQEKLPDGAYVAAEPWIAIRYGNAQWTPRHFSIWIIRWPELIWSFPHISERAKEQICPKEPWNNLRSLILERACGTYSPHEYHTYARSRISPSWRRFLARAIACSPGVIINIGVTAYFTVIALDDFILWHSLRSSRFHYRVYVRRMHSSFKNVFWRRKNV